MLTRNQIPQMPSISFGPEHFINQLVFITTHKGDPYIKMFDTLSGINLCKEYLNMVTFKIRSPTSKKRGLCIFTPKKQNILVYGMPS